MEASGRQKVTLAVLVVILVATVWVQWNAVPGGAPAAGAGSVAPGPVGAEGDPLAGVRLQLLEATNPEEGATRNPFEFAPPSQTMPEPPVALLPTDAPATPPSEEVPRIPLAYIGRIDLPQEGGRVAVLSDNRGHVFQGRQGDVIEGRYRVLRVGPESMDLAYLDGRGQQTLELSD